MYVVRARNVNDALRQGAALLDKHGVLRESRNGPVKVADMPVTTIYERPLERVLFDPTRDANPFFHLVEALWMLAGRDDLKILTEYVATMSRFSDDGGKTQPGAYGYRWRNHFASGDQLTWAIRRLKADPNDRRVIIQMYDADIDQPAADNNGKDIPCNIVAAPWIDAASRLSMTIFCRSNDMILGAYGANAVHFSFLQEYLAQGIGVRVGAMNQVSNNFHAYLSNIDKHAEDAARDLYSDNAVSPYPLMGNANDVVSIQQFDEDLTFFFDDPAAPGIRSAFLRRVACPMIMAHRAYKNKKDPKRFENALEIINQCHAEDWQQAGREWLMRRWTNAERAKDDGVNYA